MSNDERATDMTDDVVKAELQKFKEWFQADCMPSEVDWFEKSLAGDYKHIATYHAWRGWAARAGVSNHADHDGGDRRYWLDVLCVGKDAPDVE